LTLAMPMSKGHPVIPPTGELFKGKIVSEGIAYQFDSCYLDKRHSPLPVWITSLPFNIDKIQQRNHVRVDISLKAILTYNEQTEENIEIVTTTKDLSGGGALVVTKAPLPLGKEVSLVIAIPECGDMALVGDIIRVDQPKPDQPIYWIGVKFKNISAKEQNSIIKYVFKVQLERRKKGY